MSDDTPKGLAGGLTHYGDPEFSLYLRRSFARSMGYGDAMLRRPIVGIAYPPSGFNNCHRHFPELIDSVKRGVEGLGLGLALVRYVAVAHGGNVVLHSEAGLGSVVGFWLPITGAVS